MGEKEYQHKCRTKELKRELLLADVDHLIDVCKEYCIDTFTVLFGFSWGIDYHDWVPQELSVDKLKDEILQAEKMEWGQLGDNDLYITIPKFNLEILYCHHADIHIEYDEENEIVKTIRKSWQDKEWEAN